MKLQGFAAWKWEDAFRVAISACRPDADDAVVERMQLSIVEGFVETVMEVVAPELGLSLIVDVEGFRDKNIVRTIDFEDTSRPWSAVSQDGGRFRVRASRDRYWTGFSPAPNS